MCSNEECDSPYYWSEKIPGNHTITLTHSNYHTFITLKYSNYNLTNYIHWFSVRHHKDVCPFIDQTENLWLNTTTSLFNLPNAAGIYIYI